MFEVKLTMFVNIKLITNIFSKKKKKIITLGYMLWMGWSHKNITISFEHAYGLAQTDPKKQAKTGLHL
jgi:hypothetical protein